MTATVAVISHTAVHAMNFRQSPPRCAQTGECRRKTAGIGLGLTPQGNKLGRIVGQAVRVIQIMLHHLAQALA